MALKTILAAGFVAIAMAFIPASSAQAGTKVIIGIGTGGWVDGCYSRSGRHCGWRPYPRHYYYQPRFQRPVYYYDDRYIDRRPVVGKIGCGAAGNLVARHGYNRVKARDCGGTFYSFKARKNGRDYIVRVNSFSRRIVGVNRI